MGSRLVLLAVALLGVVMACETPRKSPLPRRPDRPPLTLASVGQTRDDRPPFDDATIDWSATPVMDRIGKIASSLVEAEYSYGLSVNEKKGIYRFDCSGMVQWVLKRSAPVAASTMAYGLSTRPLARDFQRRIARAPVERVRGGWQRLSRVSDLKPGDVVAWLKPVEIESPNTGHVAFVLLPPVLAPGYENAYLVRIADSTRLLHDDDTRAGRSGFGFGTILLVADPDTGAPIAFGWAGLRWRAFETPISLGRPSK